MTMRPERLFRPALYSQGRILSTLVAIVVLFRNSGTASAQQVNNSMRDPHCTPIGRPPTRLPLPQTWRATGFYMSPLFSLPPGHYFISYEVDRAIGGGTASLMNCAAETRIFSPDPPRRGGMLSMLRRQPSPTPRTGNLALTLTQPRDIYLAVAGNLQMVWSITISEDSLGQGLGP